MVPLERILAQTDEAVIAIWQVGAYPTGFAFEVLALMAEGRSNAGIAHRLWITEGTVEKHVRSILARMQLPDTGDDHRRVLAVLAYLESR